MAPDRFWPLVFAAYVVLQAAIRVLTGPALELDEAEAFWFARHLAYGYNAQPPLYFWLQWGAFQIFGEGIPALAAVKAGLLWTAAFLLYRLLRQTFAPAQAALGVMALGLLPQVLWESQRALTHSVLVLCVSVALFAATWAVLQGGRWRDYLILGAVAGLGILSKYNFALLPVGLLAAIVALPSWRRRLVWLRVAAAAAVAALVVLPHGLWVLGNPDIAGHGFRKLETAARVGAVIARLQASLSLALGLVAFAGGVIVIAGGFALARDRARRVAWPSLLRFLLAGSAGALAVLWLALLVMGATTVKDRWLLPLAWPLAPVAALVLWPLLPPGRAIWFRRTLAGLWLLAACALPYATLRDPGYRAADFAAVRDEILARAAGLPVLSDEIWILGNIAYAAPELGIGRLFPDSTGPALVVTEAGQGGTPLDIPHGARSFAAETAIRP